MAKVTTTGDRKITFGKKRKGIAKKMNTPKGKGVSKYRGQGR